MGFGTILLREFGVEYWKIGSVFGRLLAISVRLHQQGAMRPVLDLDQSICMLSDLSAIHLILMGNACDMHPTGSQ